MGSDGMPLHRDLPDSHVNQGGAREAPPAPPIASAVAVPGPLDQGVVRAVTAGELNRYTSETVRSVEPGERLVVTRHHEPQALVLSIPDAIELMVATRLGALAVAAREAFEAGETFAPWPRVGPTLILVPATARNLFRRLAGRNRGGLRRALCRAHDNRRRPLWLPTGRWLVPFSIAGDEVALVHDLIDTRPLERALIGEEAWRERLRVAGSRRDHGRA